jgi:hypothetical protein
LLLRVLRSNGAGDMLLLVTLAPGSRAW